MKSLKLFYEKARTLNIGKSEEKTKNTSSGKLLLDVCHEKTVWVW